MTESAATLSCTRCGAGISNDELAGGLAVRVDGELVCQMCVDSLPGEAVVRINQVRAMRGLEVTTYSVKHEKAPRLQLFSFTTSANISNHRRKLASDGFFDAPPLPPPGERQRLPTEASSKVATDRVARGQMPARGPMLIAAGATVVVLAGIAIAIAVATPGKKPVVVERAANEMPTPPPTKAMKTRLDYPVDALEAWTQASQDPDCPTLIRQSIAQELIRKRSIQLDEAETALQERRLDDVANLTSALILPDDIAFRELRRRENDIRTQLRDARMVAAIPAPPPADPEPKAPPPEPVVLPPPTPPPAPVNTVGVVTAAPDGSYTLKAEDANITATQIKLAMKGPHKTLAYWSNAADVARWKIHSDKPSRYRVEVRVATESKGGAHLLIQVGDQRVVKTLPITKSWEKYELTTLGEITIQHVGEIEVRAGADDPAKWRPLNLAEIIFHPTTEPASSPTLPTDPTTTPPAAPTPAAPDKPTVVVTAWNHAFVPGGRSPKVVALDGSEHVPAGLPGGVEQVFRSTRSTALKRHAVFLDLGKAAATNGGVVVLVHPGRNDRNEIVASLTDGKGTTVKFEVIALPNDTWTPIVLPVSAAAGLDASQLVTLGLEDGTKAANLPDDAGFLVAKTVTVSGREPKAYDLKLRAPALLADPNRLRNLPKLLDMLAKSRKKTNYQKLFEPARMRILSGTWSDDPQWRLALRKQLETEVPGKYTNPLFVECPYGDKAMDALTVSKGLLDPAAVQIVVMWTGADELKSFPAVKTAIDSFWKVRLEQFIDAGILPVVVVGPNLQTGQNRTLAIDLWEQIIALAPVRLHGLPVIDLRVLPTDVNGGWDDRTATLARQLVVDGFTETVFTLRRLGAIK